MCRGRVWLGLGPALQKAHLDLGRWESALLAEDGRLPPLCRQSLWSACRWHRRSIDWHDIGLRACTQSQQAQRLTKRAGIAPRPAPGRRSAYQGTLEPAAACGALAQSWTACIIPARVSWAARRACAACNSAMARLSAAERLSTLSLRPEPPIAASPLRLSASEDTSHLHASLARKLNSSTRGGPPPLEDPAPGCASLSSAACNCCSLPGAADTAAKHRSARRPMLDEGRSPLTTEAGRDQDALLGLGAVVAGTTAAGSWAPPPEAAAAAMARRDREPAGRGGGCRRAAVVRSIAGLRPKPPARA